MEKKIVNQIYFSPTGNCQKVSTIIAKELVKGNPLMYIKEMDITIPSAREKEIFVPKEEIAIIIMPIYASRLPNKIMPFIRDMIKSNGAKAIIGVTYGNRSFGDGLMELKNILRDNGFDIISACALACEHSFANKAGHGRPNEEDIKAIRDFARKGMNLLGNCHKEIEVEGNDPIGPYYQPKGIDGEPTVFLKAKVKTDSKLCHSCGICAKRCPVGSISMENPEEIQGICIKCHSCVRACPSGAKYFDDPAFLSHKAMLQSCFTEPNDNRFFYVK